jgi:hypothetical protein
MIGRLIRIHSPFTTGSLYSFFDQIDHIRTTRLWYQTTFGKNWCPYPLFPEYDGLLPWANTTAGDHIFWDLSDHTHPWPIVVAESGEPTFEVFPYTMTDFLYHVITGAIDEQSDIISNIDHNHLYDPPGITK